MSLRKGQRKGNNGNHGAPGRSGRKPKPITVLKRQLAEEKKDDAIYAYSLFAAVMRDEERELRTRLDCAQEIMDRVLGKPRQAVMVSEMSDDQLKNFIVGIVGFDIFGNGAERGAAERIDALPPAMPVSGEGEAAN